MWASTPTNVVRVCIGASVFAGACRRADRVVRPYGCVRIRTGAFKFAMSCRAGGVEPRPYADLAVWYKRGNSSKRTPLLLICLAARATFPIWGRLFSAHRTLSRAPGNSKKGSQPLLGRSEVRQGEISSSQAPCPSPRRKRQVSLIALLVLSKLCPLRWDTIWFFPLGCLSLHHQRRFLSPRERKGG